jgi:hypothetical protein
MMERSLTGVEKSVFPTVLDMSLQLSAIQKLYRQIHMSTPQEFSNIFRKEII